MGKELAALDNEAFDAELRNNHGDRMASLDGYGKSEQSNIAKILAQHYVDAHSVVVKPDRWPSPKDPNDLKSKDKSGNPDSKKKRKAKKRRRKEPVQETCLSKYGVHKSSANLEKKSWKWMAEWGPNFHGRPVSLKEFLEDLPLNKLYYETKEGRTVLSNLEKAIGDESTDAWAGRSLFGPEPTWLRSRCFTLLVSSSSWRGMWQHLKVSKSRTRRGQRLAPGPKTTPGTGWQGSCGSGTGSTTASGR